MFQSGRSSAKVLSMLTKFNGIVSWICFDMFGVEPEFIPATSARKEVGIKIQRGQKAKTIVLNYLIQNYGFDVEYTRYNNPKAHYYDMADGLVIALAGFRRNKQNVKL